MRRRLAFLVALAAALLLGAGWADEPPIQVTIRSQGPGEVREGAAVRYDLAVHNRSAVDYPDTVVVQMFPGGFRYDRAEPAAVVGASSVEWAEPLAAGETAELTAPDSFTTTVCVRESAAGPILTCSSLAADLVADDTSGRGRAIGVVAAAGLAAVGAAVVIRRRRQA